jgi:hypothetical protein
MSKAKSNVTVSLFRPLQKGDATVYSITLTEPSVGELRGLKLSDILQMDVTAHMTLWSRINAEGLSVHELNELSVADLTQLSSKTMLFFVSPLQAAQIKESLTGAEQEPTVN